MKFQVPSESLYSYAAAVSKVINSKNALQMLNNFLFELSDGVLKITASDVENTISASLAVTAVEGQGSFCIDARRMVELFREIPAQGLTFEIDETTLAVKITASSGVYNLVAINGSEYPETDDNTSDNNGEKLESIDFTCPTEQVMSGLDNTMFAVSTDELRPQMMGVLWDIKKEGITFVSTDTRKLVRYVNNIAAPGVEGSFILPTKPATIIRNIFGKDIPTISVSATSKGATFKGGDFVFNCRFIKGRFPDYERVIPRNNPCTLTVDRHLLINALRRVAVFAETGNGLVKFRFTADKLTMKAQDNNVCSRAVEDVPCVYEGHELIMGFSASFLTEICNTITTDEMVVKLADPSRPGVFYPSENPENTDLLMLLMPMNVVDFN